jgi:hypothetical protein
LEREITKEEIDKIADVAKAFSLKIKEYDASSPVYELFIETIALADLVVFSNDLKKINKFIETDPVTLPGVNHNIAAQVNKQNREKEAKS